MKIVFPNSKLIASTEAIEFRQGVVVKHPAPALSPEFPWEGVLTYLYGSVIKKKHYRMWYQAWSMTLSLPPPTPPLRRLSV